MAAHQLARLGDVLGALNEGQADPVGVMFDGKGQIAAVFFGERRHRDHRVGDINALAIRNYPAHLGRAQNFGIVSLDHAQPQLAIVDQQALAGAQHAEQFGMRQLYAGFIARLGIAVQREMARMADDGAAILEGADAQLGPLQIA